MTRIAARAIQPGTLIRQGRSTYRVEAVSAPRRATLLDGTPAAHEHVVLTICYETGPQWLIDAGSHDTICGADYRLTLA